MVVRVRTSPRPCMCTTLGVPELDFCSSRNVSSCSVVAEHQHYDCTFLRRMHRRRGEGGGSFQEPQLSLSLGHHRASAEKKNAKSIQQFAGNWTAICFQPPSAYRTPRQTKPTTLERTHPNEGFPCSKEHQHQHQRQCRQCCQAHEESVKSCGVASTGVDPALTHAVGRCVVDLAALAALASQWVPP